jgi:hypothetical protein
MMVCASDNMTPTPNGSSGAQASTIAVASSLPTNGGVCGCQSCLAAQPDPGSKQIAAQLTPRVDRAEPTVPASVTRSPVLPPPEHVA